MTKDAQLSLGGVVPPVVTPLTSEGDINLTALEKQISFLISAGVQAVFVLGTCGENVCLTDQQRMAVLKQAVAVADPSVPVLAGVLEPSTPRALAQLKGIATAQADAVVVTTPYYNHSDASDQIHHFCTIAQASPVPVIVYNIPSHTHNEISPDTMQQLLAEENIVAIKDSTSNWATFSELLSQRAQRPGFAVLQGAEQNAAQSLLAGADGIVPSGSNLFPGLFVALATAAQQRDVERINALDEYVQDLRSIYTHGYWLSCLKYGLSLIGLEAGRTVSHHAGLNVSAKAAIRDLIERLTAAQDNLWEREERKQQLH